MSESSPVTPATPNELQKTVTQLGLHTIQRHLFLCADQTKPKCCSKKDGIATWDYLKKRLKDLGLDQPSAEHPVSVFRTKANCLRVCTEGPILLVYPDGVWYRRVTPTVVEQIIQDHLINNRIVEDYVFCTHSLSVDSQTLNSEETRKTSESGE
ncbi:ferredoxin [Spirulina sp. CS-785/01]|uniref:(2Fe-2S) ferredoxin domain-containing protein n=1 Tax=Spirulina sp. CS-785/01 TaxID=3021716 RepID=UPI00232F6D69|nr:ferredoxin [Spirulina sp. CS-785/01]MDB9313150.1 ferredoxin [Spirulina sp. CS-785/01]